MQSLTLSYQHIRQAIGGLGIALPLLIYLHTGLVGHCWSMQDSISHYFYTTGTVFFEGILWVLGLVLIYYPSYDKEKKIDKILTVLSGFFAWGVAMIPTNNMPLPNCAIFTYPASPLRNSIHYFCAASMLAIFSFMSLFLFTRSRADQYGAANPIRWKKVRNTIYRVCGAITALSILTIAVLSFTGIGDQLSFPYVFWFEVTSIVPFGVAWLIKGGFLFTDENEVSTVRRITSYLSPGQSPGIKSN
ncbi:MAG TPA: hypothetical protein PLX35_11580 [Cyclobacteriaceae bacterium]|nr:hypothetical protein [Cyclobacteriaceae bacterium]